MPSAKRPFPYHFSPPFLDPIFFLMVRRTWYDSLRLPLDLSRVSGCEIRLEMEPRAYRAQIKFV